MRGDYPLSPEGRGNRRANVQRCGTLSEWSIRMTQHIEAQAHDRREFLRALARAAGLTGLGLLAGRSIAKGIAARNGDCVEGGACPSCPAFGGCRLPAASETRARVGSPERR